MNEHGNTTLSPDLSKHIFEASAAMIGACLAVLGLVRILGALRTVTSLADDVLAGGAALFFISCMAAYAALRSHQKRMHRLERVADVAFVAGLIVAVSAALLVVYALAQVPLQ